MANTITVYCPRGCNVVDIPAERVSEECAGCGARMTAGGADGFYHYREDVQLQQFEEVFEKAGTGNIALKFGRITGPSGVGKSTVLKRLASELRKVQLLDLACPINICNEAEILVVDHVDHNIDAAVRVVNLLKSGRHNNIEMLFIIGQEKHDAHWYRISSNWDCEIVFESPRKFTMEIFSAVLSES